MMIDNPESFYCAGEHPAVPEFTFGRLAQSMTCEDKGAVTVADFAGIPPVLRWAWAFDSPRGRIYNPTRGAAHSEGR